jgi:hypothetical protein
MSNMQTTNSTLFLVAKTFAKPRAFFGLSAGLAFLAGCPIYGNDRIDPTDYSYNPTPSEPPSYACYDVGCPSGQVCVVRNGRAQCQTLSSSSGSSGSSTSSSSSSSSGGSSSGRIDAGPDGSKPDSGVRGCNSDTECVASKGAGARCLSGTCTAPDDLCNDSTQCRDNQRCVEGACTATCSANKPCPAGFGCNLEKGVCTENPKACAEGGSQCSAGETCVQARCVPSCGTNGQCGAGLICVNDGCVPDTRPVFSCSVNGEIGNGAPGKCAVGSVCLRKSCYISCDPQNVDSCKSADKFNKCKTVPVAASSVNVCGSDENLGNECNLQENKPCSAGAICIDGFCK